MPPRELPSTAVTEVDEVARAEARAAAARARAIRLRQLAEAASDDQANPSPDADDAEHDNVTPSKGEIETASPRRSRRPSRKALAFAAAGVVMCTSLSASGYIVWHHRVVGQQRARSAEYATVARDAVTAMISIDPGKAREDMQHFSELTTGVFKASVLMSAEDFVKAVEQSKIRIKGVVQDVAVQSMTKDSAIVLVAAKSELTKPDQPKPESRSWRIVVHLDTDGSQLKVSKFEFVP